RSGSRADSSDALLGNHARHCTTPGRAADRLAGARRWPYNGRRPHGGHKRERWCMPWPLVVVIGTVAAGLVLYLLWRVGARAGSLERARTLFQAQRPQLEASFLAAAAASGKPRGLRWVGCEWEPGAEFARERATGRLAALVGITIRFEAVQGSDMEGLAAV